MSSPQKDVNVRIPADLWQQAKDRAVEEGGRSLASLIREALSRYLGSPD
jgi:hypothetical protein